MAFLAALLLWGASSARAHENCDGSAAAYVSGCCGLADSLRLPLDHVAQNNETWLALIDGEWRPVVDRDGKAIELLPVADGPDSACFIVWYRRVNAEGRAEDRFGTGKFIFYCLQGPLTF
jgi:hypothetical protein